VCVNSFFLNPSNFASIIPANFSRPLVLGRVNLESDRTYYYFCLLLLFVAVLFVKALRNARPGRVFMASRDNIKAAEAMAVPTVAARLTSFTLAGALAGIAGALYVTTLGSVGLNTFDPSLSLLVFSMAVIGGLGSIGGVLMGVAVIQIATYSFPSYQQIIAGTGLLVVLLFLPGGLDEGFGRVRDVLLRIVARRRDLVVPSIAGQQQLSQPAPSERAMSATSRPSGRLDPTTLLSCCDVETSYGSVPILFGVDFDIKRNEIVALLGTNGAGKSTLLRCLSGLLDLDAGCVQFDGERIDGRTPESIARRGVALMPGGRGVFPGLSVEENLRLSAWMMRKDADTAETGRSKMLDLFPVLGSRLSQNAGSLSGGEQQMLSLAMSLLVTPDVLLIDELSLGLAPTVVGHLLGVLRDLHADGMTIVVVEQSINVALDVAERVVFMEKGEVRFTGGTSELLERSDLLRSVFIEGAGGGGSAERRVPARAHAALTSVVKGDHDNPGEGESDKAEVFLECRKLTKSFGGVSAVRGVTFSLADGEILGLIGHNGAGKTTLMDLISGFLAPDGGDIELGGFNVGRMAAHQRAAAGLGRTFQEARLFPSLTIRETLAVALDRHLESRSLIAAGLHLPASLDSEFEASLRIDDLIDLMGLGDMQEKLTSELSTGTRRVVELACVLAQAPKVLLLDEPSAGVAQRETEALGPLLMRVQRQTHCSMLVIEHDMPLLSSMCDRLIALELGEAIAEGTPSAVLSHPRVIASYLGTDEVTIHRSGVLSPQGKANHFV
jgi:branched-chain amino acid transport system ATP-binding protein